ncbi:pirin family protein [Gordonia sp. (in: high G+C Gram-positive bacteria)]|uniref:pirin family protein n=1 Tax=Gordonia sp. (in: high G+C Gram-positive bacteria) TaxID=84139 RepID=UPI0035294022
MTSEIIRADDRHHWRNEWLTSWQSFPATGNYDLFGNAHGVLVVHNDDVVDPGEGLDAHHHQNMEILTWVVEGAVAHRDSYGNEVVLRPGTIGHMSAGRGITHSERNAGTRHDGARLRVVQMWVAPHADGLPPAHAEHDFSAELATGEPVAVASGRAGHPGALPIANRFATLHVARPHRGTAIELPAAPFGHLYVVRGSVVVEDAELAAGDALRTTGASGLTLTAQDDAEILYWEMHAAFDV